MNIIFSLLCFPTFFSFVSVIRSANGQYQPLIFDPRTRQYFVEWKKVPEIAGPYAVACPNFTDNEISFDEKSSLDHKSLFVRNYIGQKKDTITCEKSFHLAVVKYSIPDEKLIKLGYEVYFDTSKFVQHFRTSNFGEFSAIMQPIKVKKSKRKYTMDMIKKSFRTNSPTVIPYFETIQNNNKKSKHELGFVWISKIVIRYDFNAWNLLSFSYIITQYANDLKLQCKDDDLGNKFYDEGGLKKYYDNQGNIFSHVKLPNPEKHDCGKLYECVTKYNLLWAYQFQSSSSSSISCSDFTSIPIWHRDTEELLNYSEKFLVAIAEATGKTMKIVAGTHRTLLLKMNDVLQEVFLDPENKRIPIPKIIYKIVNYQSHNCDPQLNTCWFTMVIVIHNEPYDSVDCGVRICEDKCEPWGWENIQYMTTIRKDESVKSNQIYCCEWDQKIKEKLGYANDNVKTGHLNLNNFPYLKTENTSKISTENRKDEFEEKMRQLFKLKSV